MNEKKLNEMTLDELSEFIKGASMEDLKKYEQEIIDAADKEQDDLQNRKFKMPTKNYKEVAEYIRYFLNKQTIQWQYTVGYMTMYEFWNPEKAEKNILYPYLDGILRTLGGLNFTGYDEWKKVTVINEFFKPLHQEYYNITTGIYDNAERHNIILQEMDKHAGPEQKMITE